MKKAYKKPEMYIENFRLSVNIAGCSKAAGLSEYECGVDLGWGESLFLEGNLACTVFDWDPNNKVCYNQPFASGVLFGS